MKAAGDGGRRTALQSDCPFKGHASKTAVLKVRGLAKFFVMLWGAENLVTLP